jgi:hypothetical protein
MFNRKRNSMSDETVTEPIVDGSFVETAFGREDFNPTDEEDRAKRKYTDTTSSKANGVDPKAVRQWANSQGISLPERGRFPAVVVRLYLNR